MAGDAACMLWTNAALRDAERWINSRTDLSPSSKILFSVIARALRIESGEAHILDATVAQKMGRQDRSSVRRARVPLIEKCILKHLPGSFGRASVYSFVITPGHVSDGLQLLKQSEALERKRRREEAQRRSEAIAEKKKTKSVAWYGDQGCTSGSLRDAIPQRCGTAAPPSLNQGHGELRTSTKRRDIWLEVLHHPGESYLNENDRRRGYDETVRIIWQIARTLRFIPDDLTQGLRKQIPAFAIDLAEFPGNAGRVTSQIRSFAVRDFKRPAENR